MFRKAGISIFLTLFLTASFSGSGAGEGSAPGGEDGDAPQNDVLLAGIGGVTNPKMVRSNAPKYPRRARKEKVEGQVVLQALIQADGTVGKVEVLKGPGEGWGFEAAAIEAVKQWRYEPALQYNRPVTVYYTVVINFRLDKK